MKKIILLLVFLFIYQLQAQHEWLEFPVWSDFLIKNITNEADNIHPDTMETAPTLSDTLPNKLLVSFTPSEIDSSDWKEIRFSFSSDYGTISPTSITIPKAVALADSDTVVTFTGIQFVLGSEDTVRQITVTPSIYDSSGNYVTMDAVLDTFIVAMEYPLLVDSIYLNNSIDTVFVRLMPNHRIGNDSWVEDSLKVHSDLRIYRSYIDFYQSYNIRNTYAEILVDSIIKFPTVDGDQVLQSGDTICYGGFTYAYIDSPNVYFSNAAITYNGYQNYIDNYILFPDTSPPSAPAIIATGVLYDSVRIQLTATGGDAGDSIAVFKANDTTTTAVLTWLPYTSIDTTVFEDVEITMEYTYYVFAKDSLNNLSSANSDTATIRNTPDDAAPNPGTFALTHFGNWDWKGDWTWGDSADVAEFRCYATDEDHKSDSVIVFQQFYSTATQTVNIPIAIYYAPDDTIFTKSYWYDDTGNRSTVVLDTVPPESTFDLYADTIGYGDMAGLKIARIAGNDSTQAQDSSTYIYKEDVELSNDSLRVALHDSLTQDTSYWRTRFDSSGIYSEWSAWYLFEPEGEGSGECTTDNDSQITQFDTDGTTYRQITTTLLRAQQFTIGSETTISEIIIGLYRNSPTASDSANIAIYNDSSGEPGSPIAGCAMAVHADQTTNGSCVDVSYVTDGWTLQAGTYYIVGSSDAATNLYWTRDGTTGGGYFYSEDGGSNWESSSSYDYRVTIMGCQ